jgi:hypothetical protein
MRELQNAGGILFFLLERLKTRGTVQMLVVPDRVTEVPLPAQSSVLVPLTPRGSFPFVVTERFPNA